MYHPFIVPDALHTSVTEEYCDERTNVPSVVVSKDSPDCTAIVTFAVPNLFTWNIFPVLPETAGIVIVTAVEPLLTRIISIFFRWFWLHLSISVGKFFDSLKHGIIILKLFQKRLYK